MFLQSKTYLEVQVDSVPLVEVKQALCCIKQQMLAAAQSINSKACVYKQAWQYFELVFKLIC